MNFCPEVSIVDVKFNRIELSQLRTVKFQRRRPDHHVRELTTTRTHAFTLVELLVTIAIIGILLGISLPAVQSVRMAAQRVDCSNRVRQIALASTTFETAFNRLPIGKVPYTAAQFPNKTWMCDLLPYLEQSSLWESSKFEYSINANNHVHGAFFTPVSSYGCPSDGRTGIAQITYGSVVALTSYLGVSGTDSATANGVLISGRGVRMNEITDGLSQTLMIGERPAGPDNWIGWWYGGVGTDGLGSVDNIMGVREINPGGVSHYEDCPAGAYTYSPGEFHEKCDVFHFWSPHSGGAHFALCDGSVQFLPYDAVMVVEQMATRNGHEVIAGF